MSAQPLSAAPISVQPEIDVDADQVMALIDAAFGPGRLAKTAERVREASSPVCGLVVREGGRVVGSVRLWRIAVGDAPALFLGPIAVDADARRSGVGAALVEAALSCALGQAVVGVLLVGDLPYFGRFGFTALESVRMPGPVDPRRLLWRASGVTLPAGDVVGVRD
ncbi:N-acetyltransferase [Brevundimonas sp.]|jgi:predicted N-acetyltransferase YhbS|uniref:GNAT family N-acetyltransferase n=1 Tax=Brevundimonas sp. TaxID=1871086 RepID=UPI002E0FCF5A|nr:N-acetyltransferase [Brevundimonas sp.]